MRESESGARDLVEDIEENLKDLDAAVSDYSGDVDANYFVKMSNPTDLKIISGRSSEPGEAVDDFIESLYRNETALPVPGDTMVGVLVGEVDEAELQQVLSDLGMMQIGVTDTSRGYAGTEYGFTFTGDRLEPDSPEGGWDDSFGQYLEREVG